MTFEEMLRELSGEPHIETIKKEKPKQQPIAPKKIPEPEKKYFSYETEYDENAQKTYRESIERGRKALTLDEQINIEKVNLKTGNLQVIEDEDEKATTPANAYLDAFRSLDGAKKAFVYSEVFKRKYT